jgi:gliding motility-associated-like protein
MNKLFTQPLTSLLFLLAPFLHAQNNCIEIESILVDACAPDNNTEGFNEMMRFRTGDLEINIANLNITFPSLSVNPALAFVGFIQNAATANKTQQLNATIQACGFLIEPIGGIIPPNKRVLLVTAPNVDVNLNPFSSLSDTLYIIYNNHQGAAGGHFLNYNTGAPVDQITTITYNGVGGCSETVTYFRSQLVNAAGGPSAQDGATVNFTDEGVATYINNGCTAPVNPISAAWTVPANLCATDDPIDLVSLITGEPGGVFSGDGVSGNTFNPAGLGGFIPVTYTVQPPIVCATSQPITVTQNIVVVAQPDASWESPGALCADESVIDLNQYLTTGVPGGQWLGDGISGSNLDVSAVNGTISVTYTIGQLCPNSNTQDITISFAPTPIVSGTTDFCNTPLASPLTADGQPGFTVSWYTDEALTELVNTGSTFTPPANVTATYYVQQVEGTCESEVTTVPVSYIFAETPVGPEQVSYCNDQNVPELNVSSEGPVFWFSDENLTNQIGAGLNFTPPSGTNTYYAITQVEDCQSEPITINLTEETVISASINVMGDTSLCSQSGIWLVSDQTGQNVWNGDLTSDSIFVNTAGVYLLTRAGACNTAIDEVIITGAPISVDFTAEPDSGYMPLNVFIDDFSIGTDECRWYLNDSLIAINLLTNLPLAEAGEYVLRLECTNEEGCIDTASQIIQVKSDQLELNLPNVFSPNGDGKNDLFSWVENAVKNMQGIIFDRWGKKIYEWEGLNNKWDGKFNGNEAPEGVYFYVIVGTDILDKSFERKGTVTLLRN